MLWRLIQQARFRAGFYLNIPQLLTIVAFRKRRRAFWTRYWGQAAANISATIKPLEEGFFRLERDGTTCFVRDGQVPLDSHLMLEMMGDKAMCNTLLAELGAPVIPFAVFSIDRMNEAVRFLKNSPGPVVVKPASGTGGGRGVTTAINSEKTLKTAARYAAQYDTRLLVEHELKARSYRLLFIGGRFIDAVLRDPPVVVGDGKHTIGQLVRAQNKIRLKGKKFVALSPLTVSPDYRNALRSQGLTSRSVPGAGVQVIIKGAVNENGSEGNHNVRTLVHPQTIALCEGLVQAMGVELAGIDLLCADAGRPLVPENGYVTEINTTPGLQHHFLIAKESDRTLVGEAVLEHMFSTGAGTMRLGGASGSASVSRDLPTRVGAQPVPLARRAAS